MWYKSTSFYRLASTALNNKATAQAVASESSPYIPLCLYGTKLTTISILAGPIWNNTGLYLKMKPVGKILNSTFDVNME
jgi:hypothetical protein